MTDFYQRLVQLHLMQPTDKADARFISRTQFFLGLPVTGVVDDTLLNSITPKHFRRLVKHVRGSRTRVHMRGPTGAEVVVFRNRRP